MGVLKRYLVESCRGLGDQCQPGQAHAAGVDARATNRTASVRRRPHAWRVHPALPERSQARSRAAGSGRDLSDLLSCPNRGGGLRRRRHDPEPVPSRGAIRAVGLDLDSIGMWDPGSAVGSNVSRVRDISPRMSHAGTEATAAEAVPGRDENARQLQRIGDGPDPARCDVPPGSCSPEPSRRCRTGRRTNCRQVIRCRSLGRHDCEEAQQLRSREVDLDQLHDCDLQALLPCALTKPVCCAVCAFEDRLQQVALGGEVMYEAGEAAVDLTSDISQRSSVVAPCREHAGGRLDDLCPAAGDFA